MLAVAPESLPLFDAMCERERCPFAVVGVATRRAAARRSVDDAGDSDDRSDRHADGRAARQAAEDAPRRRAASRATLPPLDLDGVDAAAGRVRRAAPPDRRQQALPDHDRRPHRRRPEPPRPDGRPVAGAGGRLRRHAGRLRAASPARRWRWASARRSPRSTRRRRAGWRSARRSPTCSPRRSSSRASSSAATGWRPAASRGERRRALRHRAGGRHGALPGARHLRAGRQGQPVDAHPLAATRRRAEAGHRAGEPDRHAPSRRSPTCAAR